MDIEPIAEKWRAFNWNVLAIDGHDYGEIGAAFDKARATKGKPTLVVAETVKGKGVSFMEGKIGWHGVAPNKEQLAQAVAELEAAKAKAFGEAA
jgi:transketolase